jgi:signal transduction histidine kinase
MKTGIRHRLVTLAVVGVVMSALCLAALARVLSLSTASRVERARDAVAEAADRLAKAGPDRASSVTLSTTLVGVRGGVASGDAVADEVPPALRSGVSRALAEGRQTHARVLVEDRIGDSTLLVAAEPSAGGSLAWAAYVAGPPTYLVFWRTIVVVLTLATALLVATALYAIVTVKRSAAALDASLAALATDLSSPVPRPPVRELADVADGIAALASRLLEARRKEEILSQELAQRERLAALGRVVAGVAHEVRNPLASIKLRLDLAAATKELPPSVARSIVSASSEIERLDRLVADLLVVSGRAIGPRKPESLGALAKERVEALAPWAAERDVAIEVVGDATAPVDPDSLARAIDNLVRNAVEASPPGERVEVVVQGADEGAQLVVRDHGAGVPDARASELFEPFFTTKPEGTGLGLALSRSIARAHGGDVTYARDAAATSFEITIGPVDRGARSEGAFARPA